VNRELVRPISRCAVRLFSILLALCCVVLLFASAAKASVTAAPNTPESCNISAEDAAGLKGDAAIDVHATSNYSDTARRLLTQGKFDELDCLADGVRANRERFSGGMWKIHLLYAGLANPLPGKLHATESDWQALLAGLQQWVNQKPKSVTAHVALASAYIGYAWVARGSGYTNTVSDSGWNQFDERIAKAKQLLDGANALPTKCPEWFVVMLNVAQAQSWQMDQSRALFDQAIALEPGYYYYSRTFANFLLPQWFGEKGDVEKFAEQVADQIGGEKGDALYFQIANYMICGCPDEPKMSWSRIVKGFEASERLYGASMLNLNLLAKMATRFTDLDAIEADKAFARIGDQWDEETWGTREQFDSIKTWIAGYAPAVEKRRAMEDAAEANIKTPEGVRYRAVFEKKYRKLVQQCDKTDGNDIDNMETLTSVGIEGTVEDMKIYSSSVVGACVYQKLQAFKQQKSKAFPFPPQGSYWIRLDLTKADFTPVAVKQ
jgi:hypothetical protein